jgi:hypothetical protein
VQHTWTAIHTIVGACAVAGCAFDPGGTQAGPGGRPAQADASPIDPGGSPDGRTALPIDGGAEPLTGMLLSPRTDLAPELDGVVEPLWEQATAVEYSMSSAAKTFNVQPGYGWDATVRFRSLHDDLLLYLLIEVVDGQLVDDSQVAFHDDAVELYLDGGGDRSGPYGADDHWLTVQSSGYYESFGSSSIKLDGGMVIPTATGYLVELRLLRDDLGMPPAADRLGFDLAVIDDDDIGDANADAYGLWFAADVAACDACCDGPDDGQAWCDTTRFGELVLVD